MSPTRRIAQVVGVRAGMKDEYLRLHSAVWPEVEQKITECGIRNYTIFLMGDTLFSYYEYVGDDYDADMARIAADPASQRWWTFTDPCQERLPGTPEGKMWLELPEIWHLD
jgi:L-rhamnose mutarotase